MKTRIEKNFRLLVIGLAFLMACMGCSKIKALTGGEQKPPTESKVETKSKAKKSRKTPHQEEVRFFVHTVAHHGETISIIASWYTKDMENWKVVAEVNPDIDILDVDVGDRIRIPEYLIKTHEPMQREYVESFYDHEEPGEPVPSQPDEEPPLFGPK